MRIYGVPDNFSDYIDTIYTVNPHINAPTYYSDKEEIPTDEEINLNIWKFFNGDFELDCWRTGDSIYAYSNCSDMWFSVTKNEFTQIDNKPKNIEYDGTIKISYKDGEYVGYEIDEW